MLYHKLPGLLTLAFGLLLTSLPVQALSFHGFFYDDGHDYFISTLRQELATATSERDIIYTPHLAEFDPMVQLSQIRAVLADPDEHPDFILVNPTEDRMVPEAIRLAAQARVPVIFQNRIHDQEVLRTYDRAWCLKDDLENQGRQQAEVFKAIQELVPDLDHNHNGYADVVILTGEANSRGAIIRTEAFINNAGTGKLPLRVSMQVSANWSGEEAFQVMRDILTKVSDRDIDAVICNNDAMALGAVRALNEIGYNTGDKNMPLVPVIGIDGTNAALEAIVDRRMIGTVEQPVDLIAETIIELGDQLARGPGVSFTHDRGLIVDPGLHTVYVPDRLILRDKAAKILKRRRAQ